MRRLRFAAGTSVAFLGCLASCLICHAEPPAVLAGVRASAAFLAQYRALHPIVISVSPDGRRVVCWDKRRSDREGMYVLDAATGMETHTLESMSADPILRVQWRPDGRALAFFRQEAETNRRRLFIWDLEADKAREQPIPLSHAQAIVRWSPDGARLAFTTDAGAGGLLIVDPQLDGAESFLIERNVRAFAWSADSTRLAVVPEDGNDKGVLLVLDPADGAELSRHVPGLGIEWLDLEWQPSTHWLLRFRRESAVVQDQPLQAGEERTASLLGLLALDPSTGREEILHTSPDTGAIHDPRWLPRGGVIWHRLEPTRTALVVRPPEFTGFWEIPFHGWTLGHACSTDGTSLIAAETSGVGYNRLYSVALDGSGAPVPLPFSLQPSLPAGVVHGELRIRALDGSELILRLARLPPSEAGVAPAVVVRAVAGTRFSFVPERWTEMQTCLANGAHVIHVPSRPGHGPADIVAAVRYARQELGVPRERIAVLGSSTRAGLALQAAVLAPADIGVLLVCGLFKRPVPPPNFDRAALATMRVLAFHGGADQMVPPEYARSLIEEAFGPEALHAPRGLWHVFPGEDHSLARDASRAAMLETVLRALSVAGPG